LKDISDLLDLEKPNAYRETLRRPACLAGCTRVGTNVYEDTRQSEFSRDFGLKDQIRRAAVSVMSNIAEGFNTGSDADFIRFSVLPPFEF